MIYGDTLRHDRVNVFFVLRQFSIIFRHTGNSLLLSDEVLAKFDLRPNKFINPGYE